MVPSEVDFGWCDIVEGLVVAVIVVVVDETSDFLLEVPREVIGLQVDGVFSDR